MRESAVRIAPAPSAAAPNEGRRCQKKGNAVWMDSLILAVAVIPLFVLEQASLEKFRTESPRGV